jgi:hypothetical protein
MKNKINVMNTFSYRDAIDFLGYDIELMKYELEKSKASSTTRAKKRNRVILQQTLHKKLALVRYINDWKKLEDMLEHLKRQYPETREVCITIQFEPLTGRMVFEDISRKPR